MNSTRPLVIDGGLTARGLATTEVQDAELEIRRPATCPMCHTSASVTQAAIEAGGDWRCVRCGQHWDARRLAKIAAYAEWARNHERGEKQAAEGEPPTYGDAQGERLGGRP